jgi:hypothetical protein
MRLRSDSRAEPGSAALLSPQGATHNLIAAAPAPQRRRCDRSAPAGPPNDGAVAGSVAGAKAQRSPARRWSLIAMWRSRECCAHTGT